MHLSNSLLAGPITNLLSVLCVMMKNLSHASAEKGGEKTWVSNFEFILVVFKRHQGSEGVNVQV